jgi:hypothetical protein
LDVTNQPVNHLFSHRQPTLRDWVLEIFLTVALLALLLVVRTVEVILRLTGADAPRKRDPK